MEKPETNGASDSASDSASDVVYTDKPCRNTRCTFVKQISPGKGFAYYHAEDDNVIHSLFINRAVVGAGVDPDEMLLLQMETKNQDGVVELFPIGYLRGKDIPQLKLNLNVVSPSTFSVPKGKGSVYLIGEYSKDVRDDDDDDDDDDMADEAVEDSDDEDAGIDTESKKKTDISDKENAPIANADRKRKHDGKEDAGSKKLRVSEETAKAKGDEPMDEVKTTA